MTNFLLSLTASIVLCVVLKPLASYAGWADMPNWRKNHEGDIPLIGGPAIVLGVSATMLWQADWAHSTIVLGWTSLILFFTGLFDDRKHIHVPVRFMAQIFALLCMAWYGDVVLHNFGNLFWNQMLDLGPLAVPITIFSALGVINAFNMIDGLDGLSGSIALVALGALAFLAGRAGYDEEHRVLLIVFAAVLGFLLMNFRFPWRERALVFLGDSGSSWLGFVMAWFFISLSQNHPSAGIERAFAPIIAIWLFGLPIMDTTYVIIRRAQVGEPIFGSDRRHLHHRFLHSGFSVRQTWAAMVGASLFMAVIGIVAELSGWPEWMMFYAYVGLSICYLYWMNQSRRSKRFLGRDLVQDDAWPPIS